MKKRLLALICAVAMFVSAFTVFGSVGSYADGTHGFYMKCDANVVEGKSDGFMIDFYSDAENAWSTYYSNANWSMYTKPTMLKLKAFNWQGGGAYAGLQILGTSAERRGIMSFWRYEYKEMGTLEEKTLYAEAVVGKTTKYDNEGSGTSCVMEYNWKCGQWYRELLYCWTDEKTGNTFMGNWYYDYETDTWDLFAYYDTKLIESYITGGIGQFLENFNESKRETVRSFRYKGVYFLAHSDARDGSYKQGEWISSPSVYLYSDGNVKAVGEATLGAADDGTYVWGEVDGTSKVDTDERIEMRHTLNQPEKPEAIGEPVISTVEAGDSKKGDEITKTRIQWETGEHSTPQLSYTVVLTDKSGNEIGRASGTRPEVREVSFPNTDPAYKCEVTVTDVFGKTTTATDTSEAYGGSEDPTPTPTTPSGDPTETPSGETTNTPAPSENTVATTPATSETSKSENDGSSSWVVPVVIAVAAVAVVGGGCGAYFAVKKKKKK